MLLTLLGKRGYNQRMLVRNVTRGTVLATELRVARSFWSRLRGLMFAPGIAAGGGLLIRGCRSIHTHFLRFAIDVAFLDAERRVTAVIEQMPPWRIGRYYRGARDTLELPAGVLCATGTRVGDLLSLEGVPGERV